MTTCIYRLNTTEANSNDHKRHTILNHVSRLVREPRTLIPEATDKSVDTSCASGIVHSQLRASGDDSSKARRVRSAAHESMYPLNERDTLSAISRW